MAIGAPRPITNPAHGDFAGDDTLLQSATGSVTSDMLAGNISITGIVDDTTIELAGGTTIGIKNGGVGNTQIAANAAIVRSKLATEALAIHTVPLANVKQPTGIAHTASTGSGIFAISVSSDVQVLIGEAADGNTKTSVAIFQVVLPDNYVAGGDIKIRVPTQLKSVTGTGVANNGSDLACVVKKQAAGAVGSDLVASGSPATYAALDTYYSKDFVVTATGLVAGDVLNVKVTGRAIENDAGNGTLTTHIGAPALLCDVKG